MRSILLLDGVYHRDNAGQLVFVLTLRPTAEEMHTLASAIHWRLLALMKRRGMLSQEDSSHEEKKLDALNACGKAAPRPGSWGARAPHWAWWVRMRLEPRPGNTLASAYFFYSGTPDVILAPSPSNTWGGLRSSVGDLKLRKGKHEMVPGPLFAGRLMGPVLRANAGYLGLDQATLVAAICAARSQM